MRREERELPLSPVTFQSLVANYEQRFLVNPLENSRVERIVIPRQCLLFILHRKYKQTVQHVGLLAGKDHATVIHSCKVLDNALHWRNVKYIDAINNWSKVFDDVIPNSQQTKDELSDRITYELLSTMLSDKSKMDVLDMVREKLLYQNVDEGNSVVI